MRWQNRRHGRRLGRAPREPLAALPTPLHPLPRFGAEIGAEVWIKRDDAGPAGLAGNKVRKLEFVLAAARRDGADAIVIVGAEQSNACRAAAAACAQLGLRCVLVLSGEEPGRATGNLLLDRLYGADVRFAGRTDWAALADAATQAADDLRAAGGTHAGLVAGRRLAGRGPRVRAIGVAADIHPDMPAAYAELATGALQLLGDAGTVGPEDLWLDMGFLGPGYAVPTEEANAAIRLLARTEGIVCDPVYSGKALAAVVAAARGGDGPVVFWHTGGWHALFAPRFGDAVLAASG